MSFRRKQAAPQELVMDTGLIGPFEQLPPRRAPDASPLVNAVLFASGKLVEADSDIRVLGLIASGYEGLQFGDDGTYTARVASELPLERWDGVRRLEEFVNDAVRSVNPAYVAEHVGFCDVDEASVHIRALTKQMHGLYVPANELSWQNGQLSLDQAPSQHPLPA